MDVQIEERDEAGNLMATYAGSSEKGGSGGRWDVIVCRPRYALVLLGHCVFPYVFGWILFRFAGGGHGPSLRERLRFFQF